MMEAVREQWTDARLDDLNHRVDTGFTSVSREFQALRLEMRTEFVAVRSELAAEFAAVRSEASAMHQSTLQIVLGGFGLMLVGFAGTIATVLTQV
jgi:hypothetical protein